MKKILLFLTLFFTVNTLIAQSFTEGTDMAGTGTGLTYTVSGPSIVIGGALNTPADGQDRFRVLVPAGCQITGVSYTMTDPAGLNGTGFFHFNSNNDVAFTGATSGSFPFATQFPNTSFPVGPGTYDCIVSTGPAFNSAWTMTFTTTCGAVCTDPTVPTVSATPSSVCPGSSATLNISGTLNDATAWHIYTGSCGGTQIGTTTTGTFNIPSVGSTTQYFVRGEGGCVTPGSCGSTTVNVLTPSTLTSATASTNNVCPSTSINLTANGVTAGSGATLTWYTGAGGTGSNLGTSNPLNVSPATTTTYYARLAGTCNSVEQSVTVTVDKTVSSITSATASTNNVCPSTSINLTANGVTAGSGATLTWYTGAGGTGSNLGTSNPLNVSPATTTTYYARLAGTCNSVEQSVTVTVDKTVSSITSATASTNNVCPSTSINLTANGVTAGSGATLTWYTGAGGTGSNLGTSNPLNVSPATTTTYYARLAGTCNSVEQSVTVTVDKTVSSITSATASTNNVCPSTSINLTANGVTAGSGATLTWYTGAGGTGSNLGTSNPLNVSPATTTTYYARLAGTCNSVEQSVTVTVDKTVSSITSATASTNNVCPSTSINLTANGVTAGSGATLTWYTGAGGTGSNLGTSNPLNVSPATTTTYYARLAGTCNSVEQSVTVITQDTTAPVVTCPADLLIECDADSSPANTGIATSTDNCDASPVITFTDVVTAGVGNNSSIARTWTATDANGNSSNCIQTLTITDTTAPVVTCPADLLIECDADSTPTNTGTATATDNCDASPVITFADVVTAGVGNNSSIARTWTATDANGNSSNCIQTITITDTTAPVVTCPADLLIECDADSSPANTGIATSTDNCDASPVITFADVVTAGVGNNSSIARTWTATDANGNSSNCIQTITITDTTAPVVTCPADLLIECDADSTPTNTGTATATDNCDASPVITFADVVTAGVGNNSSIARTWTATDANGNSSNCIQTIIITDTTAPVVTCPADLLIECDADSSPANTGIATSTDNCDVSPVITFSDVVTAGVGNNSSIARTWTATDANGNASNCIQTITITDTTAPIANLGMLADIIAECSATVTVTPTATDNCAGVIIGTTTDSLTYNSQGNFTITWSYEDDNGNTSTQAQNVIITDITPPTVVAQGVTITLDENGEGSITPSDIDNGSSDNCNFTLSLDINTFDCYDLGDYPVVFSVEDEGGNITSTTVIVTVLGDDLDGDLIVDACDDDDDNDGVLDINDNCQWVSNPAQIDLDQDNIGDSCDDFIDILVTPNDTITPNGDGQNDLWVIENIWRYPNAIVRVFNRHGVKVFEGRNYNDNWGGNSIEGGSGLLPVGSYYYSIELNQPEFGEYGITPLKGWMYINY